MHGPGRGSTEKKAVLSNVSGSHCSAPGHFEVTLESGATIRPSFRLKGLDKGNSNAYNRAIMLHGGRLVDQTLEQGVEYLPINANWCAGCVTVSCEEMDYLEEFIRGQKKHLLLWSFESKKKNRKNK